MKQLFSLVCQVAFSLFFHRMKLKLVKNINNWYHACMTAYAPWYYCFSLSRNSMVKDQIGAPKNLKN